MNSRTEEDLEKDIIEIENISEEDVEEPVESNDTKTKIVEGRKKTIENISEFFTKKKNASQKDDLLETLKKLSDLKESGIITQEEFDSKKAELLSKI